MNYYELLEITTNATEQEIKLAYRRLAKQYHPDINKQVDGKKMQALNHAYKTLSNPDARQYYDRTNNIHTTQQQGTRQDGTQQSWQWENFYKAGGGFDSMWDDMIRKAAWEGAGFDWNTTQEPPKRRPLTVARIKRILREDLDARKTYQAYRKTQCDLCTATLGVGAMFYFVGNKQKMCEACKRDITKHL